MNTRRAWVACAGAAMLLLAVPAHAQNTAYKCPSGKTATYSDLACTGGQPVGAAGPRKTDKATPVPQDRAKIARRARLTPEQRAECKSLDDKQLEQEGFLKAKGKDATLEDEMPLVFTRKRLRELRC